MDNIRKTIEIIFKKQSPEKVLENLLKLSMSKEITKDTFTSIYSYSNPSCYNKDEIESIWNIFNSEWKVLGETKENLFNVLVNFTKNIIVESKNEPLCKYEKLLKWRELSYQLGEDLLVCADFAYKDIVQNYNRTMFSWKPVISTNNNQIKEIMKKGCAENHFHLKGSAPHFQLAWISLMNDVNNRDEDFKILSRGNLLSPHVNYTFDNRESSLHLLVIKAATIRCFLYQNIIKKPSKEEKKDEFFKIKKILKSKELNEVKLFLSDLQKEINSISYSESKTFGGKFPDYMIPKNISDGNYNEKQPEYNGNILLYGERYFLYSMLKEIYVGTENALLYQNLFLSYLIIKCRFRDELIQINDRVGFGNFADYQNRKSIFIEKPIYENAVINMAINSSLYDQNIEYLEARIAPKDSKEDLDDSIKLLEKSIKDKCYYDIRNDRLKIFEDKILCKKEDSRIKHYYTIHFIKDQEKYEDIKKFSKKAPYFLEVKPQNYIVRAGLKKKADAIINLRKSSKKTKKTIYGIDAANYEIGCRPEVFAQCFRYLRNYKIKNEFESFGEKEIWNLGITYHAGEDFYSLIDGLRAIDETIRFLEYEQGDRLGHALALGVDPGEYYSSKNYVVLIPKQVHLDNISWLLAKAREYDVFLEESLKSELVNTYYRLYSEIYDDLLESQMSPELYYMAWKLRGDKPEKYLKGNYENKRNLTFWEKCDVSELKELEDLRANKLISKLYHCYHFNKKVKEIGSKDEEVKINKKIIRAIADIQRGLQEEISRKNICIETNPSSNYVIGSFKRYDKHPIKKFYNLGLNLPYEETQNCSQISVSINTDDQGVFATYLENEYALMALALEKEEDENGVKLFKPAMVYEWLDRIRAMGLEQSFKRRQE